MQANDVKSILQEHFPDCEVTVSSDGSRFTITVIGDVFEGLNALKRQQQVYAAINQYIADGSIHAVTIKAYTHLEQP